MNTTDMIINYLIEKYQPEAIITYGSFADGSANENSDYDALVIANHTKKHDATVIGNIILDVFVYPPETFQLDYHPNEFVQIFDGKIILDKKGIASKLQKQVLDYISQIPLKTDDEIKQEIDWCEKMLSRTVRGDSEGYYRWHCLLYDSLEIYYDIKRLHYYGPKKALRYMAQTDAEMFRVYSLALKELKWEHLSDWIARLKKLSCFTSER